MRITENTTLATVRESLNKSRSRMNDLQKQNASLKRINAPSDDPSGTAKLMSIRNEHLDNTQYEKNSNLAKTFLNYTDSSLEELTNIVVRAKELALGQASSAANGQESRLMVAEEIRNLMSDMSAISNRKLGDRYIFSGYKTTQQPFTSEGKYSGDDGSITVEVQKDVFIGMNLPGREVFLGPNKVDPRAPNGINGVDQGANSVSPELAMEQAASRPSEDIFRTMEALRVGLMTNDVDVIRSTLNPLDKIRDRVITARAQVGSRVQGIENAVANMTRSNVFNSELSSSIEDADMIQVVSDMAKEETVLRASLQASNKLVQPTLLDFLK